jgi:hypothetical protein
MRGGEAHRGRCWCSGAPLLSTEEEPATARGASRLLMSSCRCSRSRQRLLIVARRPPPPDAAPCAAGPHHRSRLLLRCSRAAPPATGPHRSTRSISLGRERREEGIGWKEKDEALKERPGGRPAAACLEERQGRRLVGAALEEALVAAAWRGAEREERISWGSFDLGFHPVFFFWMFIYHRPTSLCNCHTRCGGVALWTIGPSCTWPQLSVSQTGRQEVRNRITESNGWGETWS